MSLTSVSPNGSLRWRINLPNAKDEVGNTDVNLIAGQYTYFMIYATTSQARIFIVYQDGTIRRIYTPWKTGRIVASPIERHEDKYTITFAINLDKKLIDDNNAEIHTISSNDRGDIEDKILSRFQGKINYFDQGVYSKIMYVVLKQK